MSIETNINFEPLALFTILYNEFDVIDYSLSQLRKTTDRKCDIYAVDNDYPFLNNEMVDQLVKKYDITLIGTRYNRGSAAGFNELINEVKLDYAILYDCDSNPVTKGWDTAMLTLVKNTNLAAMSLMLEGVSKREMTERGYTKWHYENYTIWKPHTACMQSTGIYDLNYLRQIGGAQQNKKYYGGSEGYMFRLWNDEHQLGYLDNYYEEKLYSEKINPLYTEYKWKYAHDGYDGSFDDFLKSKQ